MPNLLRTIVEEKGFSTKLNKLISKNGRAEDVKDGIDWILARNPTIGVSLTSNPNCHVFKTTAIGPVPSYRVLYKFDAIGDPDNVYLIEIDPIPQE